MSGGEKQIDVRTALKQGLAQLREAKVPSFTLAAELLLLHALGRERTWLYAHAEEQVSCVDADRFFALIARRARGEPTQHLTGEGLQIADIVTGSGCIAIALAKELPSATIYATDISRAALTVAPRNAKHHSVSHRIHFIESNLLERVSIAGPQEATHLLGKAAPHESGCFHLIASNPPYIGRREAATLMREVRDHEPEIA